MEACGDKAQIWDQMVGSEQTQFPVSAEYKVSESEAQFMFNLCNWMRVFWVYLLCPEAAVLMAEISVPTAWGRIF